MRAKKALKELISDDVKGNYNWVSKVIDLVKRNDICLTEILFSSSKIKRSCIGTFSNELMKPFIKGCGTNKKEFKSTVKFESRCRSNEKLTANLD